MEYFGNAISTHEFFFQLCDEAKLTIIHKKDLTKFGYRTYMEKINKNKILSHTGYLLELVVGLFIN